MIALIILSALLIIVFFTGNLLSKKTETRGFFAISMFLTAMFLTITIFEYDNIKNPKPEAIDVYRGNTELEITKVEKNGMLVGIDTTVVFK